MAELAEIRDDPAQAEANDGPEADSIPRITRATDFTMKASTKDSIWTFAMLVVPVLQRLFLEIESILFFRSGMGFPRIFNFVVGAAFIYQCTVYQVFMYTSKPNDPVGKKSWNFRDMMWISAPRNFASAVLIVVEWTMNMPGIDLVLIFFFPLLVCMTRVCWKQAWGGKGKWYAAWYVFYAASAIFGFSIVAATLPMAVPMMISVVETASFFLVSTIYASYKANFAGIVLACGSVALGLEAYRFVASLFVFQSFLTSGDFGGVVLQVAVNVTLQALVQTGAFTWFNAKVMAKCFKSDDEVEDIYNVFGACGKASRELDKEIPLYYYAFVWGSTFVVPLMFSCQIVAYYIVGGDDSFGEGFVTLASNWHWIMLIFLVQECLVEAASMGVEKAITSVDKEYTPRISIVAIFNKGHATYGWPLTITLVSALGMNCFGALSMFKAM